MRKQTILPLPPHNMSRAAAKLLGAKLQNSAEIGLHKASVYQAGRDSLHISMNGLQWGCNNSIHREDIWSLEIQEDF